MSAVAPARPAGPAGPARVLGDRGLFVALLLAICALLLGSCAEDRAPAAEQVAQQEPPTSELRLGLTEWSIQTGGVRLLPGEVQVEVTNSGGTRHDVVLHGEEGVWASPILRPGERHQMVITALAGERLHLVCTLTGHEEHGMHTTIDVVDEP